MHVHVEVVGVEERLGGEGFFEYAVGEREEKNGWPTAAGATDDLTNEESSAAIHWRENDEGTDEFDREIAEEKLGYERRDEEERNRWRGATFEGCRCDLFQGGVSCCLDAGIMCHVTI